MIKQPQNGRELLPHAQQLLTSEGSVRSTLLFSQRVKSSFGCEPDTVCDQGMGGAFKITYNLQTGGRDVISVSFPVIRVPVKCVLCQCQTSKGMG